MTALQPEAVHWFGRVPSGWSAKAIKYGFALIGSGTTPPSGEARYYGGAIPWVNTSELRENVINEFQSFVTEEALQDFSALRIYPAGTVLFAMYGATIGRVAILGLPATVNQAVCALANPTALGSRFTFYCLQASRDVLNALASGGGQPNLNAEKVREHRIPCPDSAQQRSIARFLDCETARLDALVGAKQRLLDLLAEKRKAIIATAVTRGLDPKVKLRDSGVPWLGEIPAHWGAMRVRHLISALEQGWSPEAENREPALDEWGVLKLNAVAQGVFDSTAAKTLLARMDPRPELEVQPGDVLITRANTPSLVGDACFVADTRTKLMLCDLIYRLRVTPDRVDARFLVSFLVTTGRRHAEMTARGTSNSMVKLSQEHIKDWWIPVPPLGEQHAIVDHIARETAKLDAVRAATERTIALLKERRDALIAAAVTGQLDVGAAA